MDTSFLKGLITIIFVVLVLIGKAAGKAKQKNRSESRKDVIFTGGTQGQYTANRNTTTYGQNTSNYGNTMASKETGTKKQVQTSGQNVISPVVKKSKAKTTDFLREKAEKSNREEQAERAERAGKTPAVRERRPGVRILPGDPVPHGARKVVCGYCGAENLLPCGDFSPHSCYFCRETI